MQQQYKCTITVQMSKSFLKIFFELVNETIRQCANDRCDALYTHSIISIAESANCQIVELPNCQIVKTHVL